jgi:hypothetical protein
MALFTGTTGETRYAKYATMIRSGTMGNMDLYNAVRKVPQNAQKTIKGGKLAGFTDINPMWRIQVLTEHFGPCGVGWKYEITSKEIYPAASEEVVAVVDVNLYIKEGGAWSDPIPGTGGSKLITLEKGKPVTSDECFKMALTDALSVACKALGVGADIYWSGGTKYSPADEYNNPPGDSPDIKIYNCVVCGKRVPGMIALKSMEVNGKVYCSKTCLNNEAVGI